jgi:hypothetical protein
MSVLFMMLCNALHPILERPRVEFRACFHDDGLSAPSGFCRHGSATTTKITLTAACVCAHLVSSSVANRNLARARFNGGNSTRGVKLRIGPMLGFNNSGQIASEPIRPSNSVCRSQHYLKKLLIAKADVPRSSDDDMVP